MSSWSPRTSDWSSPSRARIQLMLPVSVLISPLCAMNRYGCASGHDGKVLVLNRWCTSASADSTSGFLRSGNIDLDLPGREHALVDQRVARQADDVEELLRVGGHLVAELVHGVLDALADDVQLPFESPPRLASSRRRRRSRDLAALEAMKIWRNTRLDRDRARADRAVVGRHVAPAEEHLAFFGDDPREDPLDGGAVARPREAGTPGRRRNRRRAAAGPAPRCAGRRRASG